MERPKRRGKKFWKPPSCEDFNLTIPNKKIKLDPKECIEGRNSSKEVLEPETVDDLAIHPKKVEEVKNWIKNSCRDTICAPILLVTGPSGCGKTTTVKIVANAEGVSIREWINPIDKTNFKTESVLESNQYDKYEYFESKQTEKFEDFIFKSSRYNSLFEDTTNSLIVVEDIPNVFIWNPKHFHDFLKKYKLHGKSPIVFIITDDENLKLSNSLFPSSVKVELGIASIKFNPVNNSSLVKNLKCLADFHASEKKIPPKLLECLSKSSAGDLRSATNTLVLFLNSNLSGDDLFPVLYGRDFEKSDGRSVKKSNCPSLRDHNCDFYQVLGRILYPKLMSEEERKECENPNRLFVHDVREISGHWSNSVLGILHENYLQTFSKFKNVVAGAECFTFSDVLGCHQELQEYSSLFGVLSLMLNNLEPKKIGFNPLKKSTPINSKNMMMQDFENEISDKFYGCELGKRSILLDLIPYRKIVQANCQASFKSSHSSNNIFSEKEDDVEDDEEIQIEEFED